MAGGISWKKEELDYLRQNYSSKTTKELRKALKRSSSSISFVAYKFGLKKNNDAYCRARKHKDKNVSKDILNKLYHQDKRSVREIAKLIGLGKTTIEYYFKKYDIKPRSKSDSSKNAHIKYGNWKTGKTKENNEIVAKSIEKMKETYRKRRLNKLKDLETEFGKPIQDLINDLYWKKILTQEQISEKLGMSRLIIIRLMKKYGISKRPNFEHISSLKGEKHSIYGKKWDIVYGRKEATKRRKNMSDISRKRIIRRLQNREMPFKDTKIEKALAGEMIKREINFVAQYPIDNKFVCDFAIPQNKIIIECDGDYWHANPIFYSSDILDKRQRSNKNRDVFKDKFLAKRGWTVLRFFESDIKDSVKECVDKIESTISSEQIKKVQNPLDNL